jgi:hypothetical protein
MTSTITLPGTRTDDGTGTDNDEVLHYRRRA